MKNLILLGAGGHSSVIIEIINKSYSNISIVGFTDIRYPEIKAFESFPILGNDNLLTEIIKKNKVDHAFISVGSTGNNLLRKKLFEKIISLGYKSLNIIDQSSLLADDLVLDTGNLIAPAVVLNPNVKLGDNNIINTGSIIEHDCQIKSHVHIAPGSVIGGNVKIESLTHVGLGARIIEGISIGSNVLIGAGSVIIDDVPDNTVVVGNPGRVIRKRSDSNE
jgi:UDP-perosamine 4-acetyltransferase